MTLYEQILAVAREYMGPAAEDYIRRRIRIVQRGEEPESIDTTRLERLVVGVQMTAKGYMSERKASMFCDRLRALDSKDAKR